MCAGRDCFEKLVAIGWKGCGKPYVAHPANHQHLKDIRQTRECLRRCLGAGNMQMAATCSHSDKLVAMPVSG
jgi:hypothetical protein